MVALLCVLMLSIPTAAPALEPTVRTAVVQLRIDGRWTESRRGFDAQARRLIESIVDEHAPDLIVLPEYLGFFRAAAAVRNILPDAFDELASAVDDTVEVVLEVPDETVAGAIVGGRRVWRTLAQEHAVVIVPGTSPAIDDDGSLRNRLSVIDENGEVVYTQDKVFLTDYEHDVVGVDPGALADALPVKIDGVEIAFTVCRDTFFEAWDMHFGAVDLWIDLRANGEPYTDEVRARFADALPLRVEESGSTLGASATLTGSFAGLIWEGPSFVVNASGRRIAESPSARGASVLIIDFEPEIGVDDVSVHPLPE
jgi:predicted amidohydrolase